MHTHPLHTPHASTQQPTAAYKTTAPPSYTPTHFSHEKFYCTPIKLEENIEEDYHKNFSTNVGKHERRPQELEIRNSTKRGWTKE